MRSPGLQGLGVSSAGVASGEPTQTRRQYPHGPGSRIHAPDGPKRTTSGRARSNVRRLFHASTEVSLGGRECSDRERHGCRAQAPWIDSQRFAAAPSRQRYRATERLHENSGSRTMIFRLQGSPESPRLPAGPPRSPSPPGPSHAPYRRRRTPSGLWSGRGRPVVRVPPRPASY
jgi:hypothetical protein